VRGGWGRGGEWGRKGGEGRGVKKGGKDSGGREGAWITLAREQGSKGRLENKGARKPWELVIRDGGGKNASSC
jgi:hypothetical protein